MSDQKYLDKFVLYLKQWNALLLSPPKPREFPCGYIEFDIKKPGIVFGFVILGFHSF